MKSLVLSMLAIASISVLSSCSSESDVIDEVIGGNQDKVEIKLNAGVLAVETKSPIDAWSGEEVSFAYKEGDKAYTESTSPWFATIATGGKVSFVNASGTPESHYYNADGSTVSLIGYYPRGTYSNGEVTFALTGEEDIMVSDELSGTKNTPIDNNNTQFQFSHKLSQLKLILKAGENFESGVSVTKITLKGTKKSAKLSLISPSKLTFDGTAEDMEVFTGNETISNSTTPIKTIMVEPEVKDMKLDIVAGGTTYENIPIKITDAADNATAVNTAYDITLTFTKKEIAATASISAWQPGSGSADVF